jgi:Ca2+-binding RTX toxin-like protein
MPRRRALVRTLVPAVLLLLGSVPAAPAAAEDPPAHEYGEMVDYPLVFPVVPDDPADLEVIRGFADTFYAWRPSGNHNAQDILAPKMTPVVAAASGTVHFVNWTSWGEPDPDRCCTLTIDHDDGWESWYIHLNNDTPGTDDGLGWGIAPGIATGVHVTAGQLIGWVGDSGLCDLQDSDTYECPPHLDYSLRDPAGVIVNPYEALQAAAVETVPTCDSLAATPGMTDTDGDRVVGGTEGDDVIIGTEGDDLLIGYGGDDVICGRGGNDVILGGTGRDRIFGDDGDDHLDGDLDDDELDGGDGDDLVEGGAGNDVVEGGRGHDSLYGGYASTAEDAGRQAPDSDDDLLEGGPGNDLLDGGAGNDLLRGKGGSDALAGGDGNDRFVPGPGDDVAAGGPGRDVFLAAPGANDLDGGPGRDLITYRRSSVPVAVDLAGGSAAGPGEDTLTAIESVVGSRFDDILFGDAARNRLRGEGGDDELLGLGNRDVLLGGIGDDRLRGHGGDDRLDGGPGEDLASGGVGSDACGAEREIACEARI